MSPHLHLHSQLYSHSRSSLFPRAQHRHHPLHLLDLHHRVNMVSPCPQYSLNLIAATQGSSRCPPHIDTEPIPSKPLAAGSPSTTSPRIPYPLFFPSSPPSPETSPYIPASSTRAFPFYPPASLRSYHSPVFMPFLAS